MAAENIDMLSIDTIRFLAAEGVQKAKSGHPGMCMGNACSAYALWAKVMNHNPDNPRWINRDRFVLSAGHGSMLLYSMLHLCGYDWSLDDLKNFRQLGSKTAGHPEYDRDLGVAHQPRARAFGSGARARGITAELYYGNDLLQGVAICVCGRASPQTPQGCGLAHCRADAGGAYLHGEISSTD